MKRIVVPKTLKTIYEWKCMQTYELSDEEKVVTVKEF